MIPQSFTIREIAVVLGVTRLTIRNQIASLNLHRVDNSRPYKFEADSIVKIRASINWKKVEAKKRNKV